MSDSGPSKLVHYSLPLVVRSLLLKNPPEDVPLVDELESLHSELNLLRQKSLERAKKAGEDLRTIEQYFAYLKYATWSKEHAIEKINWKRRCTSFLY
ncbi:hypothetical protein PAXINDRAFT_120846 [Paxillus involutus ATCC 200175]|uniref:Uncharacterized protein n=1 Tax=Paxillus involutus ATCC 200175 TaxID=664439 RepID=A0A0C9TK44_PAXIN|nr:hypothetical protein PAXINDRAFT_120846 [Paxillus involutus ATCC 200175]